MVKSDFIAVGGSRSHGLEIDSSDTDLLCVGNDWFTGMIDGYNVIQIIPNELIHRVKLERPQPSSFQWIFPLEFRTDNEITRFILTNREEIINVQKPRVFEILTDWSVGVHSIPLWMYHLYQKRLMYALLFYSTVSNYAGGMSFLRAMRPTGDLKKTLLSIRMQEIEPKRIKELIDNARIEAEKCKMFYQESGTDESVMELVTIIKKFFGVCI